MALADLTFQLNNGVILNDSGVPSFVDIDKVSGLDNTDYRETRRDHEGADGGFLDAEFEKGREILLSGTVYSTTTLIESYLDSLKSNFAPIASSSSPIPFVFKVPGTAERLIFVKPLGAKYDWTTARRIGATPIQLKMYAEDPRIYDSAAGSLLIAYGGDAGFGFAFNMGFNLNFGGGATPGGGGVFNGGNRNAPVTFTITGPIVNPVITNTTTGVSMGFTITLANTDTLTINTRDHTVYLNGNINRRNTMTTVGWFDLPPGTSFIGFGGQSGSGSTLLVSYRNAWR